MILFGVIRAQFRLHVPCSFPFDVANFATSPSSLTFSLSLKARRATLRTAGLQGFRDTCSRVEGTERGASELCDVDLGLDFGKVASAL